MNNAARTGDMHSCPLVEKEDAHVGGPILPGSNGDVLINGLPAAVVGDLCLCNGAPDVIVRGSSTVMINGKPAARVGDLTAHGGIIMNGSPTVFIGG